MPLLAYCVALSGATAQLDNIDWFEIEGLRCYYAEIPNIHANAADAALEFHRINTALFETISILPFRFPTTAATLEELNQTVASQAVRLRNALQRLQNQAQFEITFHLARATPGSPQTGAEYLRQAQAREQQLARARDQVQSSAASYVLRWKESTRGRDLRLFALVEGGFQQGFSQVLQSIALPNSVECRMVGPWPATEFVDE